MRSLGNVAFGAAATLFVVFFSNVTMGAFQQSPFLGDVAEMATLLAASAAFVVGVLMREGERDSGTNSD